MFLKKKEASPLLESNFQPCRWLQKQNTEKNIFFMFDRNIALEINDY